MNFFLDPFILMIPNESDINNQTEKEDSNVTSTQWQFFAENLHTWAKEIEREVHDFWLSWYVYDALIKLERYPTWKNLQRISDYLGDNTPYDIRTVFSSCERALTEPSFLEELAKDEEHEVIPNTTVVIPKTILQCLPDEVHVALTKALTHSALVSHQGLNEIFTEMRFASAVKNVVKEEPEEEKEVSKCKYGKTEVTPDNKELQIEITAYDLNLDADEVIKEAWPIVLSPQQIEQLDGLAEVASFWEDTNRAIEWAKRRIEKEENKKGRKEGEKPCSEKMTTYFVGKKFNESIRKTHMNEEKGNDKNDKGLLETLFIKIVKCLCEQIPRSNVSKGTPNHPIREGRKSHKQVTRRRDGATAWRLRIQGDWRLHYWLLEDGSIELANVEYGHAMHIES